MIPDDEVIINFRPQDQPELPEINIPPPKPRVETPQPEGWRPFGGEW